MKVILLKDIRGIGRKYDIKEIKDGYVRNSLLPQNLVQIATPEALKKITKEKSKIEAEHFLKMGSLNEAAKKISGMEAVFNVRTGPKGEIYGSVSAKDIEKFLSERGIKDVKIENPPIKEAGERTVEVDLGEGIKASLKVKIIPA